MKQDMYWSQIADIPTPKRTAKVPCCCLLPSHDNEWIAVQQNASPPNVWLVSLSQHVVCAQLFPIADMYAGDSTIEATADAYDALTRMGINIPQGAEPKDWTGRKIGGFRYVRLLCLELWFAYYDAFPINRSK
jgi:hypothetical protein